MMENLPETDKFTTVDPLRQSSVNPITPPSRIRSRFDQISLNSFAMLKQNKTKRKDKIVKGHFGNQRDLLQLN